jgi:hypothetical protein
VETAAVHFPWRQLGELLVAEELLTDEELEQALAEQATSGRLLGQILVNNGYLSAFSLARVLSEQHGVHLESSKQAEVAQAPEPPLEKAWRPLGKVLVELEFLTESQLERALDMQRGEGGKLGEILVSRGLLSGAELAQALAEQHGVELGAQDDGDLHAVVRQAKVDEPVYKLFEVIFEPGYQRRTELFESANFLEAADYAFEFVDENNPAGLEIHRTQGAAQEAVWSYSAERAAALGADRTELVDTFGFDPTLWGKKRS